jgi:AraC-like DNA-binding protein
MHLLPFFVFFVLSIIFARYQPIETINFFNQGFLTWLSLVNYFLFLTSMLTYWIMVFRLVNRHQVSMTEKLSYDNHNLRLNWIKLIAWWILGGFLASGLVYIYFLFKNIYPFNPIEIYHFGLLIFIFSISLYGIHQSDIPADARNNGFSKKNTTDYADEDWAFFTQKLNNYMNGFKPHLDRELTLQQLAGSMGEHPQKISYCINHILHKNFFSFTNEYRVKEAMQLISNPKNKNLTLLAIAFDAGFNSKSSFNALFKKFTGYTPSEFQKKKAV